ncbi:MAG: hypothetical protein PHG65_02595 [Kiritimatiellae bacterium]|nr:hypothetical protein [Kiritimatiellia bacterium]
MNNQQHQAKKNINGILSRLRTAERFEARPRVTTPNARPTFLGSALLMQEDGHYLIDLSTCTVFKGIPQFVQTLANQFFEQIRTSDTDLLIHQPVDELLTPELAEMDIRYVSLSALYEPARLLTDDRDFFYQCLLRVFSAVQHLWKERQSGDKSAEIQTETASSWLFTFPREPVETGFEILFEYERENRFIRLTLDHTWKPRLNLKRIPHRASEACGDHLLLQDVDALASIIATAIHHECQNQREEYVEVPGRQSALFDMLAGNGLNTVNTLRFRWDSTRMVPFLLGEQRDIIELIGRALLLLENTSAAAILNEHRVIEVISGGRRAFLDLSRRNTCLNINLDERREIPSLKTHLERMPALHAFAEQNHDLFAKTSVVLVHHLTSEVLGLIQALSETGCAALHTLFIRYKGIVPDSFVEALLALPEERFSFHALQQMDSDDLLCGMYVLSHQFSPTTGLEHLDEHLHSQPVEYTPAMRLATAHIFFQEVIRAKERDGQVLLIEDGGYLAPLMNQFCLENRTVADFMSHFHIAPETWKDPSEPDPTKVPLSDWLAGVVHATVEHTRNGYDQLLEVQQAFGRLHFPAYTIALSICKNVEEARACALSLLMTTELVMNGLGDCLFNRHGAVIGSRGNIGRFLLSLFAQRLPDNHAIGTDLQASPESSAILCNAPEYVRLDDIPDDIFLELDVFLGITGVSVLQAGHMERLLLHGRKKRIYLASGSTKTAEFSDISRWIQELRDASTPTIGGRDVDLHTYDLRDPLTHMNLGTRIRFTFHSKSAESDQREIILIADGMPVNFLFYGVPGEVIDGVMCELMQMAALPCRTTQPKAKPIIHALDIHIDKQGRPI